MYIRLIYTNTIKKTKRNRKITLFKGLIFLNIVDQIQSILCEIEHSNMISEEEPSETNDGYLSVDSERTFVFLDILILLLVL